MREAKAPINGPVTSPRPNAAPISPMAFERSSREVTPANFHGVRGRFFVGVCQHQDQLIAAGIKNSYIYLSPGTTHEWQTWRRSFYTFAQLLFK